jgi:membrane protein required for colicin V production
VVDWYKFNAVDWTIIAIVGISIALSLWRGFVREALSLAGWLAAFFIANMFATRMELVLTQWIANETARYVAAFGILFVATLMLANVLGALGTQLVRVTGLSLLDRLLGTVFGFARGIIIVLVAVYLLRQLAPPQNLAWLEQSLLMPYVDMLGHWVELLFARYSAGQSLVGTH